MAGGSQPGRTVTSKVLAILAVFETSRRALSLTEVAAGADLPLSTAHRLVAELVDWGMLSYNSSGGIQLGLRLWTMAQNAGRQLRDTARPFVQDLFSLTGETSQLVVRDGTMALYVDRVYGSKRIPRASRVGGRLPLHATAVGQVLLAHSEPWVVDACLSQPLTALTSRTPTNPVLLRQELDRVRERGYAIAHEEVRLGASSIAVPVHHRDRVWASIGIVLPSSSINDAERHLPALRGIAGSLGAATIHIPLETLLGMARGGRRA